MIIPIILKNEKSVTSTSTSILRTSLTTILGWKILEAVSKGTRTRDSSEGRTLITLLGRFDNWNPDDKSVYQDGWAKPKTGRPIQAAWGAVQPPQTIPQLRSGESKSNEEKAATISKQLGHISGQKTLAGEIDKIAMTTKSIWKPTWLWWAHWGRWPSHHCKINTIKKLKTTAITLQSTNL